MFEDLFRKLFMYGETAVKKNEYKKNLSLAKATALFMEANRHLVNQEGKYVEHPMHEKNLKRHIAYLTNYRGNLETIAFGDSILDIPRTKYTAVEEKHNFAISGSWHFNMEKMALDLEPHLKGRRIDNIIIGTLGGNPLLGGQEIKLTIKWSIQTLNTVRRLFPNSRLIVYGLPPVYNIHATKNHFAYEQAVLEWVVNDKDAVYLPLQKKFGSGFMGMFPTSQMSNDGVHLTPKGVYIFDKLLQQAKKASSKSIVD